MKNIRIIFLFTFFLLLTGTILQAQIVPDSTLSTPYEAVYNHLYYLQNEHFEPNKSARSVYGLENEQQEKEMAIMIKQVLDAKGLYVKMDVIPDDSSYVDSLTRKAKYKLFPDQLPEFSVERIGGRWYYSQETINNVPEIHAELYPFGSTFFVNLLPKVGNNRFWGLALWQYLGMVILALAGFVTHRIVTWIFRFLINSMSTSKLRAYMDPKKVWRVAKIGSLFLLIYILKLLLPTLLLPIHFSSAIIVGLKIASLAIGVVLALRLASYGMTYFEMLTQSTQSTMDDQLLPIIERFIQGIIVIGGIIQALRLLDVNVTALIAGVSIGGLAIALAAQDTVKNFLGSVMIFVDRPFQIGDFVSGGGVMGVIEEVGFRSTRLRSPDTTLISIPNGKMADMTIENYGLRTFRRFNFKAGITYDTPSVLISKFVEGVKEIILNHPRTRKDSMEVHVNEFADSSINLIVICYFDVETYSLELASKHDVIVGMLELADYLGVRFAFPSTSLYVEDFPEKKSNIPSYQTDPENIDTSYKTFLENYKAKFKSEESEEEYQP